MTDEEWYDTEIAPAIKALAQTCVDRGKSFVAAVEFESATLGVSLAMHEDASLGMAMLGVCMLTAPKVDEFLIRFARHCREKGVDVSDSIVLSQLLHKLEI